MATKREVEAEIARIEERLGVGLPREYRAFALGGMEWDEDKCELQWGPTNDYPHVVDVSCFHPLCEEEPEDPDDLSEATLGWYMDLFQSRKPGEGLIPEDAISIMGCETHEHVLLFVRGERRGQVWFKEWSRLDEKNIDEPDDGVHFVADNFDAFLAMLREPTWED